MNQKENKMKTKIVYIASVIAIIGFPVFAEKAQVKEYDNGMITIAECNSILRNTVGNVKKREMISIADCKKQNPTN